MIAKAKKLAVVSGGGGDASAEAKAAFFQRALEKLHELGIAECLDCKLTQRRE